MKDRKARPVVRGFTLIEVLVALVVLAFLLAVLLQISMTTFAATKLSHQKLEADENANQVLDAIGSDCLALITENSSPFLSGFSQDSSTSAYNSQFSFLTQSRGPSAGARCMGVSYLLNNGIVERFSQPVLWTSSALPVQNVLAIASSTTKDEVASGILRLVAVASLSDGSVVPLLNQTSPTSTPTLPTGSWAVVSVQGQSVSPFVALNLTDTTNTQVRSITIAVAASDSASYRLLSPANFTTIKTALLVPSADVSTPPRCATPVDLWEKAIATGQLTTLPKPVLAALKFVQKTYFLNR